MTDIDSLISIAECIEESKRLGFRDVGDLEGRYDFFQYMNENEKGYRLPFPSLEKDFLIAKNELTLISGYTGLGKTELVNQILLDCIEQGAKGLITSLELTSHQLLKRLYIQSTGKFTMTQKEGDIFHDYYQGKLVYWDGTKLCKLQELLNVMIFYFEKFGHTVFVLDNMMMLGARPDDYNKQYETVDQIKNFCKIYPVSVFLVAHPRKPKETIFTNLSNPKESSFEVPTIYDVSGSATIVNLVDNYLALGENVVKTHVWKEIKAERLSQRDCEHILKHGDVMLKRNKRREYGSLFNKELFFDANFRRFKEKQEDILKPYVTM